MQPVEPMPGQNDRADVPGRGRCQLPKDVVLLSDHGLEGDAVLRGVNRVTFAVPFLHLGLIQPPDRPSDRHEEDLAMDGESCSLGGLVVQRCRLFVGSRSRGENTTRRRSVGDQGTTPAKHSAEPSERRRQPW